MLLDDGGWICAYCRTGVAGPTDRVPEVKRTIAGRADNQRILWVDGEAIHRCEVSSVTNDSSLDTDKIHASSQRMRAPRRRGRRRTTPQLPDPRT